MDSRRWQQIDNLLQTALAQAPNQRSLFLAQACSGDEPLRLEVESLIASHEQAGNLLEVPLSQIAADLFVESQPHSVVGQTIGPYKVLDRLGTGGMGDVYLARDPRLDRRVALKLLPNYFIRDANRLHRFAQEARAASSLNHPNILTIYEIGHADGHHFIATEFIDGVTLRERLTKTEMTLSEALNIAGQIAGALAAAHAANIVHRDIKPENIMIRGDGYVKVLDFGLAKLTESRGPGEEISGATVKTNPGMVMGTAHYMSPEQARGLAVDERTDIWSLGVVLYEIVAGHVPFQGETATDVILSVVEREPLPLAQSKEVPGQLAIILDKSLRKKREERYQTIQELAFDLRSLEQKLATLPPPAGGWLNPRKTVPAAAVAPSTSPDDLISRPTSSAEYIISGIRSHQRTALLVLATLLVTFAAVSYFFYFTRSSKPIDSIAVMPFVNVGADSNLEYLSDGLSDSVINNLSELSNLKVSSFNSVLRYKGRQIDPKAVGRELNVTALLISRLIRQGDDLSVSTELIDVKDNHRLWGQQYNRKLADAAAVPREIAQAIAEKLRLTLSGDERKHLAKHYTENTEAYEAYWKGRLHNNKRTPEELQESIRYFQRAIELDPNFALPYAGLASSYNTLGARGTIAPTEAYAKVTEAAMKALELDDTLAEAHNAQALAKRESWDFVAAEKEFKRAIELNGNYAEAHHAYSHLLIALGRPAESLSESQRLLEIDPLDLALNAHLGWHYLFTRQYDQAIEKCLATLAMGDNFFAHLYLGQGYEQKGRYEEAIAEFKKAIALSKASTEAKAALGHAYAVSGRKSEAETVLEELAQSSKQSYVSPVWSAIIYAGLGDKNEAFKWLQKAYQERSNLLIYLNVDPTFDGLRSDPRFEDLRRHVGLAQ